MKYFWVVVVIVVIIVGYKWLAQGAPTDQEMMESETMMQEQVMEEENSMMEEADSMLEEVGMYVPYSPEKLALAQEGKVVLYFRAPWCPTCRALDADIRANLDDIPTGVVILDTDYDNSKELKEKYGITYQHTFVQVDTQGHMITKWAGSPTLSALLSEIK